jgi:hypothetical protein
MVMLRKGFKSSGMRCCVTGCAVPSISEALEPEGKGTVIFELMELSGKAESMEDFCM